VKTILSLIFFSIIFQNYSSAFEIDLFLKTHLKCEMFEREYNHNNDLKQDRSYQIKSLPDDEVKIFLAFDEKFVFYFWDDKKKNYELKDEIIEFNELRIKTEGQYYNWDEYLNYREFIKDKNMRYDDLIVNPGSYVFHIDREKGELIRYDIWRNGGGFKDKFNCKKISYFSLPKKKINKKF
jgi:hypothetical protein